MAERIMQIVQIVDAGPSPLASQDPNRYLQPKQAQRRQPTNYEDLLGDAIERAYAAGIHDLEGLVASLNSQGMTTRAGEAWTVDNYGPEMADLSA